MKNQHGFTFLEILITISIIAIGLTSFWGAFAAGNKVLAREKTFSKAIELAVDLQEEILRQSFEDPDQPPVFGPETGEAYYDRYAFDDIDDYNNWSHEPPVDITGRDLEGSAGFKRSISVVRVEPDAPDVRRPGSSTDCLKITVVISKNNKNIYELKWLMWKK